MPEGLTKSDHRKSGTRKDDCLEQRQLPLALITSTFPGLAGKVRTVEVWIRGKTYCWDIRRIVHLHLLNPDNQSSEQGPGLGSEYTSDKDQGANHTTGSDQGPNPAGSKTKARTNYKSRTGCIYDSQDIVY